VGWKKILLVVFLIIDGLAVNAGAGYLIYKSQTVKIEPEIITEQTPVVNTIADDERFVNIDSRIRNLEDKLKITPAPTEKPIVVAKIAPKTKTRTVQYVAIPGSGSTQNNTWTNISGTDFYFNPADYPGLLEIYFEANIKLFNGNGMAYVQLFNATSGVGVQGSDIQINSQADTLVTSGKVTFWAGKNLIRVQAKSLTADTAVYNSGRLRIVTEN
jgi:hypothetical protein